MNDSLEALKIMGLGLAAYLLAALTVTFICIWLTILFDIWISIFGHCPLCNCAECQQAELMQVNVQVQLQSFLENEMQPNPTFCCNLRCNSPSCRNYRSMHIS